MDNFNLEEYLEELKPLINVDCGTSVPEGVATIADIMTSKYENIGWHVEREDLGGKCGPGLKVTNKADAEEYDILLIGHMDTVFPAGTVAEWSFSRDEKKAYGPGVIDMKSGLLNIFTTLKNMPKDVLDRLSICVLMNPDEEIGSVYSSEWIKGIATKSKCALVAEPARVDGSLVKARKGLAVFEIDFIGKAAHAGNEPEKGISAITEMAQWITRLNQETNFERGTTLNFGIVSGGNASNVVPEQASTELDVRYWQNEDFDKLETLIHEMAEKPFLEGIQVKLNRTAYKPAFIPTEKSEKLMALIEESGKQMGLDVTWQAVGGGSDANFTGALGIPTVDGLGPIGGGMHSRDEYLVLDSIEPRLQLLRNVIINIAEQA